MINLKNKHDPGTRIIKWFIVFFVIEISLIIIGQFEIRIFMGASTYYNDLIIVFWQMQATIAVLTVGIFSLLIGKLDRKVFGVTIGEIIDGGKDDFSIYDLLTIPYIIILFNLFNLVLKCYVGALYFLVLTVFTVLCLLYKIVMILTNYKGYQKERAKSILIQQIKSTDYETSSIIHKVRTHSIDLYKKDEYEELYCNIEFLYKLLDDQQSDENCRLIKLEIEGIFEEVNQHGNYSYTLHVVKNLLSITSTKEQIDSVLDLLKQLSESIYKYINMQNVQIINKDFFQEYFKVCEAVIKIVRKDSSDELKKETLFLTEKVLSNIYFSIIDNPYIDSNMKQNLVSNFYNTLRLFLHKSKCDLGIEVVKSLMPKLAKDNPDAFFEISNMVIVAYSPNHYIPYWISLPQKKLLVEISCYYYYLVSYKKYEMDKCPNMRIFSIFLFNEKNEIIDIYLEFLARKNTAFLDRKLSLSVDRLITECLYMFIVTFFFAEDLLEILEKCKTNELIDFSRFIDQSLPSYSKRVERLELYNVLYKNEENIVNFRENMINMKVYFDDYAVKGIIKLRVEQKSKINANEEEQLLNHLKKSVLYKEKISSSSSVIIRKPIQVFRLSNSNYKGVVDEILNDFLISITDGKTEFESKIKERFKASKKFEGTEFFNGLNQLRRLDQQESVIINGPKLDWFELFENISPKSKKLLSEFKKKSAHYRFGKEYPYIIMVGNEKPLDFNTDIMIEEINPKEKNELLKKHRISEGIYYVVEDNRRIIVNQENAEKWIQSVYICLKANIEYRCRFEENQFAVIMD